MSKPYPSYKDSGLEWLDILPSDWVALPIRALAKGGRAGFTDGDWIESPYITDEGVRLIQTGNVGIGQYREQGFRYVSEETFGELSCTEVLPGDVLICRLAAPVGRACLAPDLGGLRMITSVDVAILKPAEEVEAGYITYLLSCPEYLGYLESVCRGGTRDRVSRSFLGGVRVPCPPTETQRAIATFLDRETAKIDALVDEQRRLIDLLKEKRQAVISHAVTKGLDPSVPMRDSGVEWLGKIPAHWEALSIRHVSRDVQTGATPKSHSPGSDETGVPWLTPGDFASSLELSDSAKRLPAREAVVDARVFPEGTVMLVGIGATLGKVGYLVQKGSANQQVNAILPDENICSQFLAYALIAQLDQIRCLSNSSTIGILNQEKTKQVLIAVPPVAEQKQIVRHLDKTSREAERLGNQVEAALPLLQERRAALISAVVTGKIDVRDSVSIGDTEAA